MKEVIVNDKMQQGYVYCLLEPIGKNFHLDFKPELTPQEMLEVGVFGGKYLTDCQDEFPDQWFVNAQFSPEEKDISLNYFRVDASQPLKEWLQKGWLHPQDPRGWFQWYCRYYMRRRTEQEDARQIKRWFAFRRHRGAIKKYCEPHDYRCRKKQRQALLH